MKSAMGGLVNLARSIAVKARVRLASQGPVERVQLETPGGVTQDVERFENFGFASACLPGCDSVRFLACGTTPVALGSHDRRYRPTDLQPGDVCMYNEHGDRVTLHADRKLEAAVGGVRIEAGAGSIKLIVGSTSIEVASSGVTIVAPAGVTTFE